jgi:cell division protein FtsB
MRDFTKRRNRADITRRFLLGIFMLAFLTFISFGAAQSAWGMYGKFVEATDDNQASQQNLAELKQQEASVEAEVASLNSPVGVEAQLRQSYGVALPGESEIQIVHETATTTAPAPAPQGNFFARILKALF